MTLVRKTGVFNGLFGNTRISFSRTRYIIKHLEYGSITNRGDTRQSRIYIFIFLYILIKEHSKEHIILYNIFKSFRRIDKNRHALKDISGRIKYYNNIHIYEHNIIRVLITNRNYIYRGYNNFSLYYRILIKTTLYRILIRYLIQ